MPETTTATVAPARPPFTGTETIEAVSGYIAQHLNALAGTLPDGRGRFNATGIGVVYVETGLTFRVKLNRGSGRRSSFGAVNGVSPFTITCDENVLNPPGATGERVPGIAMKLHANGEARWSKLHMAALVHAQRSADARERLRLQNEAKAAGWAKLAAYMTHSESANLFPTPAKRGNLDPAPVRYEGRKWEWIFTVREAGEQPAVEIRAHVEISGPEAAEAVGFDPEKMRVALNVGFSRYDSTSTSMTLPEAFTFIRGLAVLHDSLARSFVGGTLTQSEAATVELTDPRVCPQCSSDDTTARPVHVPGATVAVPADGRICNACGFPYVPGTTAQAAA